MNLRKSILSFSILLPFVMSPALAANYKGEMPNNYKDEMPFPSQPTEPYYSCGTEAYLCDGLYFGGGVSYDAYKVRQNTLVDIDADTSISINPAISVRGWDGRLLVGFGMSYEWFYLGAEFMGDWTNAEGSYAATITDEDGDAVYAAKFKAKYGFGGGLLPGIKVNQATLLYGRVGILRTNFHGSENISFGDASINFSKSKWLNGVNYGLGMETAIGYWHMSMRTEYTYTSYQSICSSSSTKFSPVNNQFVVDFIFHVA